jgi:type I restriction enzyme S subunit
MWINRVATTTLMARVDCEFYEPNVYVQIAKLSTWKPKELNEYVTDIRSEPPIHTDHYSSSGIHIVSPTNFTDFFLDLSNTKKLGEQFRNSFSDFQLESGRILFALVGDVGHACVVPNPAPDAISYRRTANLRLTGIDPYFVCTFLNTNLGACQLSRMSTGVIQAQVRLEDSATVLVPSVQPSAQKYIGDKVRQAERLRAFGNQMMASARAVIELINDGQLLSAEVEEDNFSWTSAIDRVANPNTKIDAKHDRVNAKLLGDRIDSWFYKPEFVRGDARLQAISESGVQTPTLESFASVSYGFMPTEDYWSSNEGALFLRVTNIQDNLRLDLSKLEFVNPKLSKAPRYRLQEDDIVCVQCGNSTGRIALISSRCNDWVFPSFALRLRLKNKEWDAAYVAGYLASRLGQSQIQRTISITSVRPNTTKPAIEAVTVPKLPLRTQQLVGKHLRNAISCVEQSVPLCDAAKLLVEALIERKVTEDELIYAQTRLEQGDDSADRAILSRVFAGGLDATSTPPLFPDLDAYYETLKMVEREQTEVAAK